MNTIKNTRLQAAKNEEEILIALAHNGWMTARMIALWVWNSSTEEVGKRKARLVLQRLEEKGQVIVRMTEIGLKAWILSQAGEFRANAALKGDSIATSWAKHSYDLGTLHYQKQADIVEFLARKRKEGYEVYGRRAVQSGILNEQLKVFDAVIEYKKTGYISGVLRISNCAESTETRIAQCREICDTLLIGDPQVIIGLQKREKARELKKAKEEAAKRRTAL